jgi:membrane protease YdiL (CAAX protease family)
MRLRVPTELLLRSDGWARRLAWAGAPLLCLLVPGPGVIAAALWVIALLAFGRQPFRLLGLIRPSRWAQLIVYALVIALAIHALAEYAIGPFANLLTGESPDASKFENFAGNWQTLAFLLSLSWIVGATLEEIVFRGFMVAYGALIFGERYSWPLAAFSSVVFGLSHLYQGTAGVLVTGIVGFLLATIFILSKKNLPLLMLAHGFVDSISMLQQFLGLTTAP